ncbi:hypothetical protein, partial [Salmonella enterica]|uniref:hypothetical protein n=1 Tax=Salmonella enterica TaxID=28901 RepID=UPI0039EAD829
VPILEFVKLLIILVNPAPLFLGLDRVETPSLQEISNSSASLLSGNNDLNEVGIPIPKSDIDMIILFHFGKNCANTHPI